ncbi:MAG TPA: NUDIX domain-containing protein [Ktedonobacterales bacterium]|nr:NUDIX domain-containing protein [Ktedonobacterales bacterium]
MTLAAYKAALSKPLRLGTVTFLLREQEVLLGLKKRGFGVGNYVGIGGKVEEARDRTSSEQDILSVARNGAVREIEEEIGVKVAPGQLQPMGVLRFYFPEVSDESWNQEVYVFTTTTWEGEPFPRADAAGIIEITPEWFRITALPLEQAWDDEQYWLPAVLAGKHIDADFVYDAALKVAEHTISYR